MGDRPRAANPASFLLVFGLLAWAAGSTATAAAPGRTAAGNDSTAAPDTASVGGEEQSDSLRGAGPPALERRNELATTPDSLRVLLDVGARSDVTNEQYVEYQDAFTDTTFLVRRRISTPEHRVAGVMRFSLVGTRADRTTAYQLTNDLQLGDLIQQNAVALAWRTDPGPQWRIQLSPRLELRHDRTFGRDLEELRAGWSGRVRRELGDGMTHAELGTRAEVLRSHGAGGEFLLDRDVGGASLALERTGLFGDEWRVGVDLQARAFPDSANRDHLETRGETRWRRDLENGGWLDVEAMTSRRATRREVPNGHDNFWNEEGTIEARFPVALGWACNAKVEGEAYQYDVQDTSVFFDYQVARAHLGLRFDGASRWAVTLGPRGELLVSSLNPGEGYQEIAAVLETEYLGGRSWWTVAPAIGWRDYDEPSAAALGIGAFHSSFAFYEFEAFGDQPLAAGVSLRGLASLRWEDHIDQAQDASSLYVSFELRRSLR